jgi:hypothetical protein
VKAVKSKVGHIMKKSVIYSVLSLLGVLSFSVTVPALASGYRVLKPQADWADHALTKNAQGLLFCSVVREYETGNSAYLSLQGDVVAATFEISHLNLAPGQNYRVNLKGDEDSLYRAQNSNLQGHHVKIPFGTLSEYQARIEQAGSFKLSVGAHSVMYSAIDASQGVSLLQDCLAAKAALEHEDTFVAAPPPDPEPVALSLVDTPIAEKQPTLPLESALSVVPQNPAMAFEGQVKRSLDGPSELLSAADELARAANVARAPVLPLAPVDAVIELLPVPELAPAPLPNLAALVEAENVKKIEEIARIEKAQPSLEELSAALPQNVLPKSATLFSKKKRAPLVEDERALFESMKTKMLLLEKEKEAVRKRLSDMRQKEIDVMKVDINSLRVIDEMAEKIRVLEHKVEKYGVSKKVPFDKTVAEREINEVLRSD